MNKNSYIKTIQREQSPTEISRYRAGIPLMEHKVCEYVSPDHCDKICDRIADAILDRFISLDRGCRTGIEVLGSHKKVLIAGEVTVQGLTSEEIDQIAIEQATELLQSIGEHNILVHSELRRQDMTISGASRRGAGDQAVCFGYASSESEDLLPIEYSLARNLTLSLLHAAYRSDILGTDGKVIVFNDGADWNAWIRWHQKTPGEAADQLIRANTIKAGANKVFIIDCCINSFPLSQI